MTDFPWLRSAGSALAGLAGFAAGFYMGLFSILGIWGLEFDGMWFTVITGGMGTLVAAAVIAWTVSKRRRMQALLTTLSLGIVIVGLTAAVDADLEALALGAVVLVITSALMVRSGVLDRLVGT